MELHIGSKIGHMPLGTVYSFNDKGGLTSLIHPDPMFIL